MPAGSITQLLAVDLVRFARPEQIVLCIDNPAADEMNLERILREIPDYSEIAKIILAERAHRYYALQRTGVLTYLHGEEEVEPVRVRNAQGHREAVYNKLFDLLDISSIDRQPLLDIVRNERLVYVNATFHLAPNKVQVNVASSLHLADTRSKSVFHFGTQFRASTANLERLQVLHQIDLLLLRQVCTEERVVVFDHRA